MSRIRLHPRAFLVAAAVSWPVSWPVSRLVFLSAHAVPGTSFDLAGRIGWACDSNLLRIAGDAPAFDNQRSDSWTTAEFGGVLDETWGRQRLSGVARFSTVRFDHFRQRDYDGKDLRASWYWRLGNAFSGELGATCKQTLAPCTEFRSDQRNLREQRRRFFEGARHAPSDAGQDGRIEPVRAYLQHQAGLHRPADFRPAARPLPDRRVAGHHGPGVFPTRRRCCRPDAGTLRHARRDAGHRYLRHAFHGARQP